MDNDGVALRSTSHPRSRWSWLQSIWWKLFPPDISEDALETIDWHPGEWVQMEQVCPHCGKRPSDGVTDEELAGAGGIR